MLPAVPTNGSMVPSSLETPVNRLSTFVDRFFNEDLFSPRAVAPVAVVPLCMWEDEDRFYIEVDVPGLTENDIDVSIHNSILLLRGERKCERKAHCYDTRSYGRFEQRITLPNWAKADKVEAKLAHGILSLTFTKGEEAKPRKISLRSE